MSEILYKIKDPIIRLKTNIPGLILSPAITDEKALKTYTRWMNDENIIQWIGKNYLVTTEKEEMDYPLKIVKDRNNPFSILYKPEEKKEYILIGNCNITIKKDGVVGVLGICIGEEIGRDKGLGTEIIKTLIKYGFEQLRLNVIYLKANGDNARAIRCYEKAGLKICGKVRESIFYDGHYADTVYLEILKKEYKPN